MSFDFGKIIGRTASDSDKPDALLAYNERRFYQMATFYGFTVATYIASKLAYRGIIKRRYSPNFYQHNHVPPKFNFQTEALSALVHATLLSTTAMGMAISGGFWYFDISTSKEFSARMKAYLGGEEAEKKLREMPENEDARKIINSLESMLNGDEPAASAEDDGTTPKEEQKPKKKYWFW